MTVTDQWNVLLFCHVISEIMSFWLIHFADISKYDVDDDDDDSIVLDSLAIEVTKYYEVNPSCKR